MRSNIFQRTNAQTRSLSACRKDNNILYREVDLSLRYAVDLGILETTSHKTSIFSLADPFENM